MFIRTIQLRNWKAYEDAIFEFPKPGDHKNVVLIGAKNGFGKTSLLEAVLLCLYGKVAMGLLPRLSIDLASEDKRPVSYDDFMERALHAQAARHGKRSASVALLFQDEQSGEATHIFREWHFTGSGKHRRGEEQIRISQGAADEPLEHIFVPRNEEVIEYFSAYIAQNILPPSLAPFFFFDGEQVQRLAQRGLSAQIKEGIEGILGVGVVKELQKDLRSYAVSHKSNIRGMADEKLRQIQAEVRLIESRIESSEEKLSQLTLELDPVRQRRDELVEALKRSGEDAANVDSKYRPLNEAQRERDRLQERLEGFLCSDLALALVGEPLRNNLALRITAEEEQSRQEAARQQSDDKLARLLEALTNPPIEPPLTEQQVQSVSERLRSGWQFLWQPRPASSQAEYWHPYLSSPDRQAVQQRLHRIEQLAFGDLETILARLNTLDSSIQDHQRDISEWKDRGDRAKQMTSEIFQLSAQEKAIELQVQSLQRELTADKGLLAQKRPALLKELEAKQRNRPELLKVGIAEKIIAVLEKTLADAYPLNINSLSDWMTEAYQALAHKKQVRRIRIDEALNVQLIGESGHDLRNIDTSAGENQIFALSLIAAIGQVVRFSVPIIMDTPLARLDVEHRLNVLNYFTNRAGYQIILLSQPNEVHGQYLATIRTRLCARFLIEHEELGDGLGLNRVHPDAYFES